MLAHSIQVLGYFSQWWPCKHRYDSWLQCPAVPIGFKGEKYSHDQYAASISGSILYCPRVGPNVENHQISQILWIVLIFFLHNTIFVIILHIFHKYCYQRLFKCHKNVLNNFFGRPCSRLKFTHCRASCA